MTKDGVASRKWLAWPRAVAIAAAVLLASAYLLWTLYAREVAPDRNEGLVVASDQLDFGEVWAESDFQWALSMHNPGPRDVAVRDFITDCSKCVSISPRTVVVPAGASVVLRIVLDLTSQDRNGETGEWHAFKMRLVPVISTARRNHLVQSDGLDPLQLAMR